MNKEKFNIIYEIATSVLDLKERYQEGYQTTNNNLVNSKVSKAFDALDKELRTQLNSLR